MIDFRYHIVSIVSIFLALAVGILLGAGPLQEDLGKTLSSQVSTLRAEKTDLRTELNAAQKQVDAGEEFATEVTTQLVSAQLGGRSVVLVTLPGTSSDDVAALSTVLKTAGATVNGTVGVTGSWTDPTRASAREEVATQLAPQDGATAGSTASPSADDDATTPDAQLAQALASALLVPALTDADQATPASTQTLSLLKQAELINVDGDGPALSTLAVVLAPNPDSGEAAADATADLTGWTALTQALDAAGAGSALVGRDASAGTGGLLAAVRRDGTVRRLVSTVDDVDSPIGRIATVYALRQQVSGAAGHYGLGAGVSAVLPSASDS